LRYRNKAYLAIGWFLSLRYDWCFFRSLSKSSFFFVSGIYFARVNTPSIVLSPNFFSEFRLEKSLRKASNFRILLCFSVVHLD